MTVDPHISDLVSGEPIPDHLPGFWDRFDAELAAAVPDHFEADVLQLPPLEALTAAETEAAVDEPERRWSVVLVAAALLLVASAVGALFALRASEDAATFATEAGDADLLGLIRGEPGLDLTAPVFAVSTQPADARVGYWRLASLEMFDGVVWSNEHPTTGSPVVVQDLLSGDQAIGETVTHRFTGLKDLFHLPHPQQFSAVATDEDTQLNWSQEHGLFAADDAARPLAYTIQVAPGVVGPNTEPPSGETMDEPLAGEHGAARVAELTELPDDFPDSIRQLAVQLTDGHETAFEKAITLQEFFHREFWHERLLPPPDRADAMETFLERKVGSTEHFAGTFAAMMRSLGVPARVIVGFTAGSVDPENPGVRIVTGEHGHAWPEVLLEHDGRIQWLQFEPTPGRRVPERPLAQVDHWHSVYAVYDCATESYLAPFSSDRDEHGIHSHGDGLIHVHPWTDDVAGTNATFDLFFETMDVEVDATGIRAAEDGIDIGVPATCLGGEPVVHLRKWAVPELMGVVDPLIRVHDIGSTRFSNDREIYVLAVAPLDAELPPLPADRLATLDAQTVPTG